MMAYHGIVIAGFGGQGVMLMGQLIATAAMLEGKHSTWFPSYGPEMRGGTANCTVVVDEKPIASPVVATPTEVVAMNYPSMMKFGRVLKSGGYLFINSSVIHETLDRKDIKLIPVPVNDIADRIGNLKVANVVMLGAFLELTKTVGFKSVEEALREKLTGRKSALLDYNLRALEEGAKYVRKSMSTVG